MRQQSVQTFIDNYAKAYAIDTLLIEQQYSMRSYETGLYDIQCDGNLKSVLNIIDQMDQTIKQIHITVPSISQMKNGYNDIKWLEKQDPRIRTISTPYGTNALENRKKNVAYVDMKPHPHIVLTYFSIEERPNAIFICPGSPRPENLLYSMSEAPWFELQIREASATFFFNANQDIYGCSERSKVFEITDFVSVKTNSGFLDMREELDRVELYFPYRLTDKDYGFEEIALLGAWTIGVTDPNNSLETLPYYEQIKDKIVKLDPKHHMDILNTIVHYDLSVRVYMPSDLRKTIHMGPVETWALFRHSKEKFLFPESFTKSDIQEIEMEAKRSVTRYLKW